ncbi:hypothetical protein FRC12_005784 [Ceratobasidium sp. 428]|nr:hypothetical protein FRC12_005784 [Ceratobasidium sp. 428]
MKKEIQLLQTDLQERDERVARLEADMNILRQQLEAMGARIKTPIPTAMLLPKQKSS